MSEVLETLRLSKGAHSTMTISDARKRFSQVFGSYEVLPGTVVEKADAGDLKMEWVRAANVPEKNEQVILFFHGGGLAVGTCGDYRHLAARLSASCGARLLMVDYRLAPEYRYPSANEDGLTAYRWLLKQGISSGEIIIGGDSAGGCLAAMTLLSLRDAGDPLPSGLFLMSAVLDKIYFDGESYKTKAEADPLMSREGCKMWADLYCPLDPKPPILSPINYNLAGLPSLFIQAGENEVLLNDSTRMAERAKMAGVDAKLEIWPGMYHDFQMFAAVEADGQKAIDHIGQFVKEHIA